MRLRPLQANDAHCFVEAARPGASGRVYARALAAAAFFFSSSSRKRVSSNSLSSLAARSNAHCACLAAAAVRSVSISSVRSS